ncbi:MAG: VanZ family protein [Anaerolineaceae bacterium]|nr:VanZ family protein [Anaerolineaceae bacterium]
MNDLKNIKIFQNFQNRPLARFLFSWLPVVLWAAIIFLFSANPDPYKYLPEAWRYLIPIREVSDSSLAEWIGQLMHFIEYAVLSLLLSRALYKTSAASTKIPALVILISMLFALSDEIHQLFVPGRAFQVVDLIIDLLGATFGVYLYTRLKIEPLRHEDTKN